MKRIFVLVIFFMLMCINSFLVSAEKQHKHDSTGMEQTIDHLILDQFNDEIVQAVKGFLQKRFSKDSVIGGIKIMMLWK